MYRQPDPGYLRHDVTILAGVRGTMRTRSYDFSASIASNKRQAYLFQNSFHTVGTSTVDVPNLTVTFGVAPR